MPAQVLLNLAINARDATPGGGTLTVATAAAGRDGDRWASLRVADTGVGIDEETQANIFDPFFTTKAVGRGTGLGLSSVLGSVEQSGGSIAVESAPGRGSRFEVRLPAWAGTPPAA